jgi:uncharacterized Fe-S cluster-containing radical SAM superfamily enzyme
MEATGRPCAIKKGVAMDLRMFYQKLRKIEQEIVDAHVVVVSHETSDGGKAGQMTEVSRGSAARLIVEGRAHLASVDEAVEYRSGAEQARLDAEQRAMAQKIQVNVVSEADFRGFRSPTKE